MSMSTIANRSWLVLVLALSATPALAQPEGHGAGAEAEHAAPGVEAEHAAPGAEAGHAAGDSGHGDPSQHFNFIGIEPGQLFDYRGKDAYGGPLGDGKMVDPATGHEAHEEEPASPPFVFVLINFAILLGLLAWKGWPVAQKVAQERHDLIKTALDEAARLRKQAAEKLAEYESRLEAADAEIKQMIEGMRADAESEKQRILATAETQAAQMKRDAELRIAAEIELARAQLTREVTAAAIAATEGLLRDRLTASDQEQLVAGFIADVQHAGLPAGAGRTTPSGQGEVH